MGKIVIKPVVVGLLATNCYIVYDDETKECFITDPGAAALQIEQAVEDLHLTPKAILLTHAHIDHIGAVGKIREKYKIPVYLHETEESVYNSGVYNLSPRDFFLEEGDVRLKDGEEITVAGIKIKVIHTPGHTPGGCCYYIEAAHALLAGDTMFRYSWGRTDFPGGNEKELMDSIKNKLLPLPEDTCVYPGHECMTNIADERKVHGYKE